MLFDAGSARAVAAPSGTIHILGVKFEAKRGVRYILVGASMEARSSGLARTRLRFRVICNFYFSKLHYFLEAKNQLIVIFPQKGC